MRWEFTCELGMEIINGLRRQISQFLKSILNPLLEWTNNRPPFFQFTMEIPKSLTGKT